MARTESTHGLRGATWIAVAQLVFMACGYVVTVASAQILGGKTGEYALFGVILTVLSLVNLTQTQGVPNALAQRIAADPGTAGAVWRAATTIQWRASAAGAIVLALLAPVLAVVLDERRLLVGLLLAALAVPSYGAFSQIGGYFQGRRLFGAYAATLGGYSVVRLILVLAALEILGIDGAVVAIAIAPLIIVAAAWRLLPHGAKRDPAIAPRDLLAFSAGSAGLAIMLTALLSIDLLVVRGATLVGAAHQADVYAAAENVARVPYYVALASGAVLFPAAAAAIRRSDRAAIRRIVGEGIEGSVAVVLPVTAILAGLASPLSRLFFPTTLDGIGQPLELLAPAFGLLAVAGVLASIANGADRQRAAMLLASVAVAVQLALGVVLARHHGGVGVATATLVACAVCLVGQAALVRQIADGLHLAPGRLLRIAAAGAVAYVVAAIGVRASLSIPLGVLALSVYLVLLVALRAVPRPLLPLAARVLPARLLAGGSRPVDSAP